jgi:hypothetical protein
MVAVVDDASSDHCELYSEIRIIGHLVAAENVNTFFKINQYIPHLPICKVPTRQIPSQN